MIKDMFGNERYKVGLHIHTTCSDGHVSPEDAAKIYRSAGFDAIALTDHWYFTEGGELDGMPIISGCEYNLGATDTIDGVMHIVGFGMEYDPKIVRATATRQEVIDKINASGGLAVLAHPAWSLNKPSDATELSGFAATEIYNSVSNAHQSSRPYSGAFVDLLANEGVAYPLIATDDAHYYDGSDETLSYIMVKADSPDTKELLRAIKAGDFYATQGPELHVRHDGNRMIVDCSSCVMIDFLSNSAWADGRITRGSDLTHAEYEIKPWEKWVRVEVHDADGKSAWSNVFMIK